MGVLVVHRLPCLDVSVVVFLPKQLMLVLILLAKLLVLERARNLTRTLPTTQPALLTTLVMLLVWAVICLDHSVRLLAPLSWSVPHLQRFVQLVLTSVFVTAGLYLLCTNYLPDQGITIGDK